MTESESAHQTVVPPQRRPRNDYAAAAIVLALAALVADLFSHTLCLGAGLAAMVFAAMGIRVGVREDYGMARAMFGLAFGLLAVTLGTIGLGFDHGAQYAGLGPSLTVLAGR